MTGTGTQTDPYLVDNIADFRSACATRDAYIKLTADLDCNSEGYLGWQTLTSRCKEVDFDGHALINPLIATSNYLTRGMITPLYKNGQILNIYENGANGVLYSVALSNMSISAFLTKPVDKPFLDIVAEECNFVINNQNLNNKAWFSVGSDLHGMTAFKDCRFELYGNVCMSDSTFRSWNSISSNVTADGCRFEGVIKKTSNNNFFEGTIQNCVFAINTRNGIDPSISSGKLADVANNTNIYQSDISVFSNHGSAIPCTSEQILDPDYLNSVGFTVAEVTP